jgi:hypothetical protein
MTICHASPDAGWLELQPFFSNVKKSLTVGMYDFILQAFLSGMRNKDLTMVLDHPSPNKTADQSDDQTRADTRSRTLPLSCLGARGDGQAGPFVQ